MLGDYARVNFTIKSWQVMIVLLFEQSLCSAIYQRARTNRQYRLNKAVVLSRPMAKATRKPGKQGIPSSRSLNIKDPTYVMQLRMWTLKQIKHGWRVTYWVLNIYVLLIKFSANLHRFLPWVRIICFIRGSIAYIRKCDRSGRKKKSRLLILLN